MFIERRLARGALIALASFALLASACAGTLDDPERFADASAESAPLDGGADSPPATLPPVVDAASACGDVPTAIFAARCASAGCHAATSPAASLDLASADLVGRLRGKAATGGAGVLLDPKGAPDASVLYAKLTASPPFGSRMPIAGGPLDDRELACVRAWVTSTGSADGAGASGAGDL